MAKDSPGKKREARRYKKEMRDIHHRSPREKRERVGQFREIFANVPAQPAGDEAADDTSDFVAPGQSYKLSSREEDPRAMKPDYIGDRDFTKRVAAEAMAPQAMAPRDLGGDPRWPQVERKATAPPAVRASHKPAVFEHHANVMRFSREGDPYLYDFDAASKSFTVAAGPGGVGAEIGPDHPAYENLMGHMREANTEADPLGESAMRPEEMRYGESEVGAVADLEAENLLQSPVGPGRGLGSGRDRGARPGAEMMAPGGPGGGRSY